MLTLSRSGRRVGALLVLSCIAFLGIMSAGWADSSRTHPNSSRTHPNSSRTHRDSNRAHQTAVRACAAHVQRRAHCASRRHGAAVAGTHGKRRTRAPHQGHKPPPAPSGSSPTGSSSPGDPAPTPTDPIPTGPTLTGPIPTAPTPTAPIESNPVAQPPQPTPSPSPSPSGFQPGIDSGANMTLDVQGSVLLGAKLVRIEFPIATAPAQMESVIAGYAAKGIRVLALASFYGTLPTPAQAQNLARWAAVYGPGGTFWAGRSDGQLAIQSIEFGNETSYGYQYGDGAGTSSYRERAENYARRLREAAAAISATGVHVGLLAQADDWTGDWVKGMYAGVPSLSDYVAGWTIHPYHNWRGRLEDLLEQTAAHGAPTTIPVDITEWGLPNDNGHCLSESGCPTYAQAGATLRGAVAEIRQLLGARLGVFILYQVRDQHTTGTSTDSEYFYGCLQHELQTKGEFTAAVQKLLASS